MGDAGMVTAELAASLPALMLVLAAALTAVTVCGQRIRIQDAAREVARAAARNDPGATRLATAVAPGAAVTIFRAGGTLTVVTTVTVHPLSGLLPAFTLTERAVAAIEPGHAAQAP
jgi:TadE-like protein